jgi:hypothetical protein
VFVGVAATTPSAHAGELTRVATAAEKDNKWDFHFGVGYDFDYKRASILRETERAGSTVLSRDLVYQQFRHTVTPTIEFGIYQDFSIYAALPVIAGDDRQYAFDQSAGGECVYPADVTPGSDLQVNCIDKTNSSTIRDGILPANGWDAKAGDSDGGTFGQYTAPNTELIFTSPQRRGLDQIHIGVKKGILSQRKWSHLPNWVIAFDGRFAIGKPMTLDKRDADAPGNSRVGRGIHEIGFWTALSRRYRFFEPFFGGYARWSLRATNTAFNAPPRAEEVNPQHTAGFVVGTEIVPWENKAEHKKVAFILRGAGDFRYGGRGYSEIWELLADSPALVGADDPASDTCSATDAVAYARANPSDPSGYLEDVNTANGSQCRRFNGITNIDNYASFSVNGAWAFHMGKYARLILGANVGTDTRHFLSRANRGNPARSGDPDVVELGSVDVNPLRRDVIDNVGRRYAIDDVLSVVGYLQFWMTF